ncbi:hypothetical protein D9M69_561690 [compost metagenome]
MPLFKPNLDCLIHLANDQTDGYGRPLPATVVPERCAIVNLNLGAQKTSVRADSSASRGNAEEMVAVGEILLTRDTRASHNDVIEIYGIKYLIVGKSPQVSVRGELDHFLIQVVTWGAF